VSPHPRSPHRLRRHHPRPRRTARPPRPAHRPTAHPGTHRPLRPAQPSPKPLPRHRPRPALRGQAPPWHCMNYLSMSVLDSGVPGRYPTETGAATLTMPARSV